MTESTWSNEQIEIFFSKYDRADARRMRDDYEAMIAEKEKRIAELEKIVREWDEWYDDVGQYR